MTIQLGSKIQTEGRQELDRKFAKGVAWAASVRLLAQLSAWSITLFVARLLTPTDYGVVAAASVYIALVRMLTEFGLGTAIVSQRSLSPSQISQLGGFAFICGLVACVLTALAAPWLAALLGVPVLAKVLPVLGIGTAIASLNATPTALIQRDLDFRSLSVLELVRSIVGSATLLMFAAAGFGYWSLVLNELCATAVFAVGLYRRTRYTLAWPRFREIRSSLQLSGNIMVSRLSWYLYSTADIAIVSRFLGAASLGNYSMAWTLTSMPSDKVSAVVVSVTPSLFSAVQHDNAETARYFLAIIEGLLAILLPATIGLALVAPELVAVVIGHKWSGAVPLLQTLAVFVSIRSIAPICGQVLIARQRGALVSKYAMLTAVLLPATFLFGSQWGTLGVARAWALAYPPLALLQFWLVCKEINLPFKRLGLIFVRPVSCVAFMTLSVVSFRYFASYFPEVILLSGMVLTGVATYGLAGLVLLRKRMAAFLQIVKPGRAN